MVEVDIADGLPVGWVGNEWCHRYEVALFGGWDWFYS